MADFHCPFYIDLILVGLMQILPDKPVVLFFVPFSKIVMTKAV